MSIAEFTYHRPATLAEACALGRHLGIGAAFLAGGTELLPDFHARRETAKHLVALHAIAELRGIGVERGELRIGALATMAAVAASTVVRKRFPALADAAHAVGNPQVRAVATIGGNFCRAVPCADTPPVAIVGNGRVRVVGTDGERIIPAELFFIGARQTALRAGEVMVDLRIPVQPGHSGVSYQRFARRRGSSLAIASAAARVALADGRMTGVRVALGAVAPAPVLVAGVAELLDGERPDDSLFAEAGAIAARAAHPITDLRSSAAFRREVIAVLAQRALAEAAARATGATT